MAFSAEDAWATLKGRLRMPGFRLSTQTIHSALPGITNFLENGGNLEVTLRITGHADSRPTKLYNSLAPRPEMC
jgi:hypothetical protein